MNYAEKYLHRATLRTDQFKGFSTPTTQIPPRYWYETITSFYKTGWFPSETENEWCKHIKMLAWCFHDFYFDKNFTYPTLCLGSPNDIFEIAGGGSHRIIATQMYNNLIDTHHMVDTIYHSNPVDKKELHKNSGVYHKWNEYEIKFMENQTGDLSRMVIRNQETETNSNGLDVILDKIKSNWQETIVIDNSELYNNLWREPSQKTDSTIIEGLFSGDKPNVFLEPSDVDLVEDCIQQHRHAIFLCILLKIPVKNQYFSLKFHK